MKQKSLLIYAVLMVAAFLFLIFGNRIVMIVMGDIDAFEEETEDIFQYDKDPVYFDFQLETYEDMKETLYISGWAFCETEQDNLDKTIDVILVGDKDTYSAKNYALTRRDVRGAFPDKKLPTMLHGLECSASTLAVKDGVYDIYFKVWENDVNYGLVKTGIQIEKSKKLFSQILSKEIPLKEEKFAVSDRVQWAADAASDGVISGWAFIKDEDTRNQSIEVMLHFTDGTEMALACTESPRYDVSDHFGDPKYSSSGFAAELPAEKTLKEYSVCVETKNEMLRTDWIPVQ